MIGLSLFLLVFGIILFLIFLLKRHIPKKSLLTSGAARTIFGWFIIYWFVALIYGFFYDFAYDSEKSRFLFNAEIQQTRMKSFYDFGLENLTRYTREANSGTTTTETVEQPIEPTDIPPPRLVIQLGSDSIVTSDRRKLRSFVRRHHDKYRNETLAHFRDHPAEMLELDFGSSKVLLPDSNAAHRFHDSVFSLDLKELQTLMKAATIDSTDFTHKRLTRTVVKHTYHTLDLIVGVDTLHIPDTISIPGLVPTYVELLERNDFLHTWNLLDFIYFSTQTITGGGYGDIIPNSTVVRIAVITETVLGYFIIVGILNVVIISVSRNGASSGRRKGLQLAIREKNQKNNRRVLLFQSLSNQRRGQVSQIAKKFLSLFRGV